MLTLHISHSDGERDLFLTAETMKELIDVKLPAWLPKLEHDLPLLKQTRRFKANPKREEKKERKSGWYYDV